MDFQVTTDVEERIAKVSLKSRACTKQDEDRRDRPEIQNETAHNQIYPKTLKTFVLVRNSIISMYLLF